SLETVTIYLGSGVGIQSVTLHVRHDANNGCGLLPPHETLADRVFAGKMALHERFVDHRHLGRVLAITLGEPSPSEQPDAHRMKVVFADVAYLCKWLLGNG